MEVPAKVKNQPGKVALEGRFLLWKADVGESQTFDLEQVAGMKATPPTAASCRILLVGPSGPLLKVDFANRDTLDVAKGAIQAAIQAARQEKEQKAEETAPAAAAAAPPEAPSTAQSSAEATPKHTIAASTTTTQPRKKLKKPKLSLEPEKLLANFELQRKALDQDPQLKKTFQETVMSGLIDNDQFWSMRVQLLVTLAQETHQSRGAYNVLSTIKPVTGSDNQINLSLTRDKIHDIFEQYPIVRKAYNDNVPGISEGEFWQKFFMSRFFLHLRGERISKNHPWDPLLDKYIDILEESIKKRVNPQIQVPMYLDVEGNSNDVGVAAPPDPTMRLGVEDKYGMGLIRQFNGLSKRLVSAQKQPQHKKFDDELVDQIRLSDLELGRTAGSTISLELRPTQDATANISTDYAECSSRIVGPLRGPHGDLDVADAGGVGTEDAQRQIMSLINAKSLQVDSHSQELVNDKEIMLCHATSLEFLRHFWDARRKHKVTPAIVECLGKSLDRIRAVASNGAALDALAPLRASLERALALQN